MGDQPPYYPPFDKSWASKVLRFNKLSMSRKAIEGVVAAQESYIGLEKELQALQCPVLVVRGGKPGVGFREEYVAIMEKIAPQVRIALLPDSGHDLMRPNPNGLVRLLHEFAANEVTATA